MCHLPSRMQTSHPSQNVKALDDSGIAVLLLKIYFASLWPKPELWKQLSTLVATSQLHVLLQNFLPSVMFKCDHVRNFLERSGITIFYFSYRLPIFHTTVLPFLTDVKFGLSVKTKDLLHGVQRLFVSGLYQKYVCLSRLSDT